MLCYLVALQIVREASGVWDRLAMSAVAAGHPELAEVADTRDVRHGAWFFQGLEFGVRVRVEVWVGATACLGHNAADPGHGPCAAVVWIADGCESRAIWAKSRS